MNKGSSSVSGSDCEGASLRALDFAVSQFAAAKRELNASGAGASTIDHQNARGETDPFLTDSLLDILQDDFLPPPTDENAQVERETDPFLTNSSLDILQDDLLPLPTDPDIDALLNLD